MHGMKQLRNGYSGVLDVYASVRASIFAVLGSVLEFSA